MAVSYKTDLEKLIPTVPDVSKIYTAKMHYETAQKTPDKTAWNAAHFKETPWGIAYLCSKASYDKALASAKAKGWDKHSGYKRPEPKNNLALKTFLIASVLGWQDLVDQLKRTLKNYGYTAEDMQQIIKELLADPSNVRLITDAVNNCIESTVVEEQLHKLATSALVEAVEKHDTLNSKLFTKEEVLKEAVRAKMLEIVDEFLDNLKEQSIDIKVDDVLLVGSNASYNYTKNSDIDLHILANTKKIKYEPDVAEALYSAFRSLFNKNLDISLYGIPLELYVETEAMPRKSNGVYSVKKDKWLKKPVQEDIPDYDQEALNKLTSKWEAKCEDLLKKVESDSLKDEKQVVKLIENIYEKLRKAGIAKSEYATENLAFKELRNNGYLDKLKDAKNELISKRLSLEERLDIRTRADIYNQLLKACGTQPILQDNGMFFIYNIKAHEIASKVQALRKLPFVAEVYSHENGKYDFSKMAMTNLPTKYYDIRGIIKE